VTLRVSHSETRSRQDVSDESAMIPLRTIAIISVREWLTRVICKRMLSVKLQLLIEYIAQLISNWNRGDRGITSFFFLEIFIVDDYLFNDT